MGNYTEIIFGASLNPPDKVIRILKFLTDDNVEDIDLEKPNHPFFNCSRWSSICRMSSQYFGVSISCRKLYYDDIRREWILSFRSSIKNYDNEIDLFLSWVSPYITQGSGSRNLYAVKTFESGEPMLYFLN